MHLAREGSNSEDIRSVEQLVLPLQCRSTVLKLAHDIPAACHLGINKTKDRVLQHYYWPGGRFSKDPKLFG